MGDSDPDGRAGRARDHGVVAERRARSIHPRGTLAAAAASDAVAGAYSAYHAELAGFLRHTTREAEVAEDLAQEAFLRLQRALLRGEAPDNPRAWLYRVATNLAISRGRRMSVARRRLAATWPEAAEVDSPETCALRQERRARLGGALADLPPEARRALMLAAQGFSGRETAALLGRSEVATRTLLCRSRLLVRARLISEEHATDDCW